MRGAAGKTLGFVLPMLRHVKDQPPLAMGDGPVALAMAPTRELVTQVGAQAYHSFWFLQE
jgi:ATP-dependent RNA helicase DDX46/PRP5